MTSQTTRPSSISKSEADDLAEIARDAATAVSSFILEGFHRHGPVEHKRDKLDLVTETDRESERRISHLLRTATPDALIIGEEHGVSGTDADGRLRWFVDPIDGTSNFVAGMDYFATSIGAEVDGVIVAGAIHAPVRQETFVASLDHATLDGRPLTHATLDPGQPGVLTSQPFQGLRLPPTELQELLELCASLGWVRNPGSYALQLAHVAAGRAQVALELAAAAPWDIAGGVALIQAIGGTHAPLAEAWPGHGVWASHSYLAVRDGRSLDALVPQLQELLRRGSYPDYFPRT